MSLFAAGPPRPVGQGLAKVEGVGQVPARRQIHTGNFPIQIHTEKFQGNLCLFEIFLISLLFFSDFIFNFSLCSVSKVYVSGEGDH